LGFRVSAEIQRGAVRNLGFRVSVEIQRGAKLGPCGECGIVTQKMEAGREVKMGERAREGVRGGGRAERREGGNLTVGEDIGCLNPQP